MTLGGLMGGSFTSSDHIHLLASQLINMGLRQEALALAQGFSRRRLTFMHDFMG